MPGALKIMPVIGHVANSGHLSFLYKPGQNFPPLVFFVGMFRTDLFEGLCIGHAPRKYAVFVQCPCQIPIMLCAAITTGNHRIFVTQRMQIFPAAVHLFLQVKYLWRRQTRQAACGKRSAGHTRQKRQRNGASANIFLFYVGFTSRLHSIIVASSPSSFAGISLASARSSFLAQEKESFGAAYTAPAVTLSFSPRSSTV